jgi:RNA polymerase sigma-70 factor (ECF subfamily)
MDSGTDIFKGRTRLPDTRWSLLLTQSSDRTWDEIIRNYWRPVYRYVRRHWAKRNEDAKDLTQQFFADLLERDALGGVRPGGGRLRHFIKACLENFLKNARRAETALKRNAGRRLACLDLIQAVALSDQAPRTFETEWRREVLADALRELESECLREGKLDHREVFRNHYQGTRESYRALAERLRISEDDVDNALRHAKARFRELVVERVRQSVATREDLEEELRDLFSQDL